MLACCVQQPCSSNQLQQANLVPCCVCVSQSSPQRFLCSAQLKGREGSATFMSPGRYGPLHVSTHTHTHPAHTHNTAHNACSISAVCHNNNSADPAGRSAPLVLLRVSTPL